MKLLLSSIVLAAALVATSSGQSGHKAASLDPTTTQDSRQKFVLDVVNSAVGLPQPDLQDRLRVLYAATNVVAPVDQKMAQQFAKEGTAIETKLVAEGQKPSVSMLAGGHVDCASAVGFVQSLPPGAVLEAEQSLLGAITNCPAQVGVLAKSKLEAAMSQGVVAARPIMVALMDAEGNEVDMVAVDASSGCSLPCPPTLPTRPTKLPTRRPCLRAQLARWTKTQ